MYHPSVVFLIHYLPFILSPYQWSSSSSSSSSSWNLSALFRSSSSLRKSRSTTSTRSDDDDDDDATTPSQIPTHKDEKLNIDPWLFGRSSLSSQQLPLPVVGILAQPYYHHSNNSNNNNNEYSGDGEYQFIAASYVKWIESGGGRSIPIPYDTTSDTVLDELFVQINGLLLPGGNNSTLPYTVRYLLDRIVDSNANGNYFPVWGTCLGFEMILQYMGQSPSVLQNDFNATNISLPLILLNHDNNNNNNHNNNMNHNQAVTRRSSSTGSRTSSFRSKTRTSTSPTTTIATQTTTTTTNAMQKSILYAPRHIYDSVTKYAITMNNHHQGIEPSQFQTNQYLTQFFSITSINYDLNFRPFVSTIEPNHPYQFPIYGVQYHPEKNAFEYATYPNTTIPYEAIDHSPRGIELSFYLAEFFMNCVRFGQYMDHHQSHQYTNAVKFPMTITYPIISGGLSFEQIYILPNASHWENYY